MLRTIRWTICGPSRLRSAAAARDRPDASGTYYEDDGLTEAWREGGWRKTRIELKTGEACTLTLTPEGSYPTAVQRVMLDLIHPGKAPFWVSRGDAMLPQYLDQRRFASAETGWYYNPGLQSVQIKYTDFSRRINSPSRLSPMTCWGCKRLAC